MYVRLSDSGEIANDSLKINRKDDTEPGETKIVSTSKQGEPDTRSYTIALPQPPETAEQNVSETSTKPIWLVQPFPVRTTNQKAIQAQPTSRKKISWSIQIIFML